MSDKEIRNTKPYIWGTILILIACICFIQMGTIMIYIAITAIGMLLIFGNALYSSSMKISIDSATKWLTLIYTIFMIYGCFFLRYSDFNWDMVLITYISNIALLVALKKIILNDKWIKDLSKIVFYTGLFVFGYMLLTSRGGAGTIDGRMGNALSGNVNTVGVSLGILSILGTFVCIKTRKKIYYVFLALILAGMLITGSRKAVVYLLADIIQIIFSVKGKKRTNAVLAAIVLILIGYLVIMEVPLFYDVIGYRFQDMMFTITGSGAGKAEASTYQRSIMIQEGLKIFRDHPIFGGGEKYFGLQSRMGYDYSHCNYIELLCNYGIVGIILFYGPVMRNMILSFRLKKNVFSQDAQAEFILCVSLGISILLSGWLMCYYTDYCIMYLSAIMMFVIVCRLKMEREGW